MLNQPNSFCRKTTMVKHQRRSHQRGMHPNELLDDCTSDSESGESPSTPKHAAMHWPTQGVMPVGQVPHGHMHRAASFGDFGQQMGYPVPHHQQHPQQHPQYAHRHSMSTNAHEYQGLPVPEHQQQPPHQQHPGVRMMHRTASMPHPYYVTEHNNPGVATMNTQQLHPQYQVPRQQQVEGLPLEIPYQQAQSMNPSIQNSPTSYSAASGRSPTVPEGGFYTHRPTQSATYALHSAPPAEQQQPQQGHMAQYHQQQPQQGPPHPHPVPSQAPQAPPAAQGPAPEHQQQQQQQQPQHHEAPQPQQVNQYPSPSPQPPQAVPAEEYWNGVPYQAPVEVATIGSLPTFGSGVYDIWGPKMEFEDPSMQLPSARIENM
jgi:hypothetical protein